MWHIFLRPSNVVPESETSWGKRFSTTRHNNIQDVDYVIVLDDGHVLNIRVKLFFWFISRVSARRGVTPDGNGME